MRKILVVVAALAMIGGACGSDSKKKADTVGESDATTTTVASSSSGGDKGGSNNSSASGDLKAKLLTVNDLPAGYKVSEDDGSDDSEDSSSDSGCKELDDYDKKYSKAADEDVEIDFEKGEISDSGGIPAGGLQFLNQSIERWASDGKADESFRAAVAAFNSCKSFSETEDDGSQVSGTMSPLSFPKIEDDTFAVHIKFTVTQEGETVNFDGDMVAVRAGKYVGLVLAMTFGGPGMPASDFEALVRKAAAKL